MDGGTGDRNLSKGRKTSKGHKRLEGLTSHDCLYPESMWHIEEGNIKYGFVILIIFSSSFCLFRSL